MKPIGKYLFAWTMVLIWIHTNAQPDKMNDLQAEQWENLAERKDAEPTDDSYEMDLDAFTGHPLNLNTAREEDLVRLHLLETLQIKNFISYRNLLGSLLSIHELQSVPGWDLNTIRHLLPYVVVDRDESLYSALRERWKGGDQQFLLRSSRVLEKSVGFEKPSSPGISRYLGNAQKIFLRYNYNYKQLLAYGFSGEKDAGEPFFRGAQRYGFDFYSFHFFLQKKGMIQALALGDFTVNLGQGLLQWQTVSFTKSSQVLAIKREATSLRPYHSAGEFNFHRGLGICLQKGKWQMMSFISFQKISTSLAADSGQNRDLFSSFQNSGYHRTASEIANRNNTNQFSFGGNIKYTATRLALGFNMIHFQFNRPFQKRDEPYNIYSLRGTSLSDFSLDYQYTTGNLHLFGELALDHGLRTALLQGALMSLGENLDLCFLYRNISPAFRSLYSDAFTENNTPNNERGLYSGIRFKTAGGIQIGFYYDVYSFPWLKYRVDAPSGGRDLFVQLTYQPAKAWTLMSFYKNEMKSANGDPPLSGPHGLDNPVKERWRTVCDYALSRSLTFTGRVESVRIRKKGYPVNQGFLGSSGITFKKRGVDGNFALTLFDTGNYDSRLYIYESDMLYNFSLPAYFGRGIHYYINVHGSWKSRITLAGIPIKLSGWLKWAQTFYSGVSYIGSGLDQIPGTRKSVISAQLLLQWQ